MEARNGFECSVRQPGRSCHDPNQAAMTEQSINSEEQAGLTCLPLSVFPGRVICKGPCGLPVSRVSPRGFCMVCDNETDSATAIAVMMKGVPQRGFKEALADVREQGRPITLDIADSAMAELGG